MAPDDASTLRDAVGRRHDVLAAMGSGVVDKRDLTRALDVSRSTVDRGVRELERLGLAERVDGGVRRTLAGTLALGEHRRTTERLAAVAASRAVLAALPNDADLDPTVLVGGEVVRPTPAAPYAPVGHQNAVIERADRVRLCATAVVEPQVELYHDQIVDHGLRVTMVATEAVLDRLVSEHRERFVATLDTGRVEVYRATRPVDYGLAVTDTDDGGEMFLSVYGDDGMVGTVGNATPEAVAWARDRVDARLDAADPVSLP